MSGRVLENGDCEEGRLDKDNQSNVSEVNFAICLPFCPFYRMHSHRCPDVCPAADSVIPGLDITRRAFWAWCRQLLWSAGKLDRPWCLLSVAGVPCVILSSWCQQCHNPSFEILMIMMIKSSWIHLYQSCPSLFIISPVSYYDIHKDIQNHHPRPCLTPDTFLASISKCVEYVTTKMWHKHYGAAEGSEMSGEGS